MSGAKFSRFPDSSRFWRKYTNRCMRISFFVVVGRSMLAWSLAVGVAVVASQSPGISPPSSRIDYVQRLAAVASVTPTQSAELLR